MLNPSQSLSEERKKAGVTWAVSQNLPQLEAEEIANQATSEKGLAELLKKAIEARQKPVIEVRSKDVIDSSEILSEDF